MIEDVKAYLAVCDNCKEHFESFGGFGIFVDHGSLCEDLDESGWHTEEVDGKNTKHYCDKCHYFDDKDVLQIKAERFKEETP